MKIFVHVLFTKGHDDIVCVFTARYGSSIQYEALHSTVPGVSEAVHLHVELRGGLYDGLNLRLLQLVFSIWRDGGAKGDNNVIHVDPSRTGGGLYNTQHAIQDVNTLRQ